MNTNDSVHLTYSLLSKRNMTDNLKACDIARKRHMRAKGSVYCASGSNNPSCDKKASRESSFATSMK